MPGAVLRLSISRMNGRRPINADLLAVQTCPATGRCCFDVVGEGIPRHVRPRPPIALYHVAVVASAGAGRISIGSTWCGERSPP